MKTKIVLMMYQFLIMFLKLIMETLNSHSKKGNLLFKMEDQYYELKIQYRLLLLESPDFCDDEDIPLWYCEFREEVEEMPPNRKNAERLMNLIDSEYDMLEFIYYILLRDYTPYLYPEEYDGLHEKFLQTFPDIYRQYYNEEEV